MPEFPSNSKNPLTPKPPEKIIESVVSSQATPRKKTLGRRLREVLIGGDTKSVLNYIVTDVLVPQAKDTLSEMVSSGIERLIYGDASNRRPGRYGNRPGGSAPTNYTQYATRGNNPIGRQGIQDRRPPVSVATSSVEDILLATRLEGDKVLERMYDLLTEYEAVSVADLHSLLNWSSSYTDQKWGWTDLQGADVRRVRDGYLLVLPKIVALD